MNYMTSHYTKLGKGI